jgi:tight adherence protein B
MSVAASTLKWGATGAAAAASFVLVYSVVRDRDSLPYRYWALHVAGLERKLRNMFITTRGETIASAQLAGAGLVTAAALYLASPYVYLLLPIVAIGPSWYIDYARKQRLRAIEAKLDSFILTLANTLKSTPNIGNALTYAQALVAPPLDDELALALKEMRVGNTLDQALINMCSRVQSVQLDATVSGMLIGRQVGGNLTQILETTASTLREMARLQGVVKAKTAEGKAQLGVLAAFPALILVAFDSVSPGYFAPLTDSAIGWVIVSLVAILWVSSLLVARKVLAVDI